MGWKPCRICMLLFWIGPSSMVLYETSKSTDIFNKENTNPPDNLLGSSTNGEISQGDTS